MSRLRITFTTSAVFLALAALTLSSLAQPPGRNGGGGPPGGGFGRGGPGGGFGGPGGGFGGPGGPGGSLLALVSTPAVQEDLKLKDKQKAQIKSLNEQYQAQSREIRSQMGQFFGGPGQGGGPQGKGQGRGRGQNGDPNAQANGQGGQGGGGGFGGDGGGGQGQDPNAPGFGQNQGGGRGNRGNGNGQGFQLDPERQQQLQLLREGQEELRQTAESSLGKILDRGQATRLRQISLQLEGPSAVVCQNLTHPHGDIIDKLQIDEAQIEMVREVMGERREAQRETRRARGEMMKTAFASLPRNPANNRQNGGDNADGQNGGNGGNGQNGGNGGNGQNGGNGRNGGRGRGGFDPEAMRKAMEDPKIQAQMEQIRGQEEKIDNQFAFAVTKVLTARQRTTYKKMLGAPFDRTQLNGPGGPWGGRRGNGPGNQAATKNDATSSKAAPAAKPAASDDDDEGSPPPAAAKPAPSAPAKAKAATTPKRKSLRELRGVPDDNDN